MAQIDSGRIQPGGATTGQDVNAEPTDQFDQRLSGVSADLAMDVAEGAASSQVIDQMLALGEEGGKVSVNTTSVADGMRKGSVRDNMRRYAPGAEPSEQAVAEASTQAWNRVTYAGGSGEIESEITPDPELEEGIETADEQKEDLPLAAGQADQEEDPLALENEDNLEVEEDIDIDIEDADLTALEVGEDDLATAADLPEGVEFEPRAERLSLDPDVMEEPLLNEEFEQDRESVALETDREERERIARDRVTGRVRGNIDLESLPPGFQAYYRGDQPGSDQS